YIENVIQMNIRAMVCENQNAMNTVYNTAYGERTNLNELTELLKEYLGEFDPKIKEVKNVYGPTRAGDVPHSLASVDKAKALLHYDPQYDIKTGLKEAVKWYWKNLK
ncbi:MAG: LPS biosynthesis protein WbpP, partial [Maribacter dokdonensis]